MSTDPWKDVAIAAALAPSATPRCARGCGTAVPIERAYWAAPECCTCLPPPEPLPIRCVSPAICVCERHAHDRAVAEATQRELARAWAAEQAQPPPAPRTPGAGEVPDWRFGPADPARVRR